MDALQFLELEGQSVKCTRGDEIIGRTARIPMAQMKMLEVWKAVQMLQALAEIKPPQTERAQRLHIAKNREEISAQHAVKFDVQGFEGDDVHERADDLGGGPHNRLVIRSLLIDECQEGVSIVQLQVFQIRQPRQLLNCLSIMAAVRNDHLGNAGHVPPLNQSRHPAGVNAYIRRFPPAVNHEPFAVVQPQTHVARGELLGAFVRPEEWDEVHAQGEVGGEEGVVELAEFFVPGEAEGLEVGEG